MYPKNSQKPTNSRIQSAGSSRKYLNNEQKDELKKQIASRLSQKYGLKYQELIKCEVNNFMDNTNTVNGTALEKLENNVKNITQQKGGIQNQDGEDDDKSIKSGHSKMSGASNFDDIDKFTTQNIKKKNDNEDTYKNKKLTALNIVKPENDLDFLEEDNEWAAIFKYNRYLYEKENELLKDKSKKQKEKVKGDLDKQLVEKDKKKQNDKEEHKLYNQNENLQLQRFDERERMKMQAEVILKQNEKDARRKQIKENKQKKRYEGAEEMALDKFLMCKVREEIDAEKNYMQFKKEHQKEVMNKLMQENNEKQQRIKQEENEEKQDNIRLMAAYAKLIDDQDESRQRTIQERETKMREFQLRAQEHIVSEHELKLQAMDKRRDKYEVRHELKLKQQDELKKTQAQQQKVELKNYLFDQMDTKGQQKKTAKAQFNEQADIWRNDNEKYSQYEQQKQSQKKEIMNEYAKTLKQQISEREQRTKNNAALMNENETLLNKQLLRELDSVKEEIASRQQSRRPHTGFPH